ncbi:MAG: saccharopine dehydrogenase [Flammeovirgaceae bacterium]|nr:saccharopine dehydrogenase [Flammeovirgaceae bacterium]
MKNQLAVYGSYGYTGKLIIEECLKKQLPVILSGRNEELLKQQSESTGLPYKTIDINSPQALDELLMNAIVVIHCAGPFKFTSKQMVEACLRTSTHYTDITGEYMVFEMLASLDEQARKKNIMMLPGAGFDVVPSDCLALHLKEKLPNATHLQLAFASTGGGLSRGTARSTLEGFGYGSMIRKDGQYRPIKTAGKTMLVNFGPFEKTAVCIPWGDIATAYRSTGIPNIEVYIGVNTRIRRILKITRYLNWLLRARWVKRLIKKQIDKRIHGPSQKHLLHSKSYMWGRAMDHEGREVISRLETLNGYALTAKASVHIAEKILDGKSKAGYYTPASAFGSVLIKEITGIDFVDVQ